MITPHDAHPSRYLNFNKTAWKHYHSSSSSSIPLKSLYWFVAIIKSASFNIKMRPHISQISWFPSQNAHFKPWIIQVFIYHGISWQEMQPKLFSCTFSDATISGWIQQTIYELHLSALIAWSVACLRCWNRQFFIHYNIKWRCFNQAPANSIIVPVLGEYEFTSLE